VRGYKAGAPAARSFDCPAERLRDPPAFDLFYFRRAATYQWASLQFRAAVLADDTTPATYSFQEAKGKLGSTREALSDAAEIAVGGPALGGHRSRHDHRRDNPFGAG
jgi:hypothetical protein